MKHLIKELGQQGQKSEDVPFNLYKAYRTVPLMAFHNFIQLQLALTEAKSEDATPEKFMDKAEQKYKSLKSEGLWDPTVLTGQARSKDMVALMTEVKDLKRKLKGKGKGNGPGGKRKRSKVKIDLTRKPKDIHRPLMIKGDSKPWFWCSKETGGKCHGILRRHKPSECEGKSSFGSDNKKTKRDQIPKKLRLKAAQAIFEDNKTQEELEQELADCDLSSVDTDGWERMSKEEEEE